MNRIKTSWIGARITFSFIDCPSCKKEIVAKDCQIIEDELKGPRKIKEKVLKKAIERAKIEGIDKDPRLVDPDGDYFNNLEGFVL